jgi:NAD-dependent SIR2 family protein deacetylase
MTLREPELATARKWLAQADAVLIVAGAGMSYGLDLKDNEGWEGNSPTPPSRGMDWAYSYSSAATMWGTEGPRLLRTIRFWTKLLHAGYPALKNSITGKDYFVYTSNVDHRFFTAGFDPERIYIPQGDLTLLQCSVPCSGHLWDAEPAIRHLVEKSDSINRSLLQPEVLLSDDIPRCPKCSAPAYKHTRHNELFTHGGHDATQDRMVAWLRRAESENRQILVLEVGCGFQTPTVCRFPAEAIARQLTGARLVRISASEADAQVPPDLADADKALSLVGTAEGVLLAVAEGVSAGELPSALPHASSSQRMQLSQTEFAPPHVPWTRWLQQLRDPPLRF